MTDAQPRQPRKVVEVDVTFDESYLQSPDDRLLEGVVEHLGLSEIDPPPWDEED